MGTSRQNPPNNGGMNAQSPFATGNAMDPNRRRPQWNPQGQTQANLQGNQRTRAELEALRRPRGWDPSVAQPPDPNQSPYNNMPPANNPISNTPGYLPPALQPMNPQTPTTGAVQPPGSIGQPAPTGPIATTMPIQPDMQPIHQQRPTMGTVQPPGSIGQPAPINRGPISNTPGYMPPQLGGINQNAGPGGKGGTRNAPQYQHLTGLLGGRGG